MSISKSSSRESNQDTSRAKKSHVLLNIANHRKLARRREKITDLLARPGVDDIEFYLVLIHRFTMVTRDVADFQGTGVAVENYHASA